MVPIAVVVLIVAFIVTGSPEQPVAERRPPPGNGLTNDVGDYNVGSSPAVEVDTCFGTVGVGGSEQDRAVLSEGLRTLCSLDLPEGATGGLAGFAAAGGEIRFAQFEVTGVDSTVQLAPEQPQILLNNKFAFTAPMWVAPVVAHDALMRAGDPASAETALQARTVEDAICDQIVGEEDPSRGCVDAATLLALDDPIGALRAAGYR